MVSPITKVPRIELICLLEKILGLEGRSCTPRMGALIATYGPAVRCGKRHPVAHANADLFCGGGIAGCWTGGGDA